MKDWKAAAGALAPDIPQDNLAQVASVLETLEAAFEPLLESLPIQTEPAYLLLVFEEPEQ
jgi:hypothetical protein